MAKQPKRLMIMAAGTGGHIFPGIAIAQSMRERGWEVSWLGTAHGMERDIVPKHGIAMDSIDFAASAEKIAEQILSEHSKKTDDAMVLTARHRGLLT